MMHPRECDCSECWQGIAAPALATRHDARQTLTATCFGQMRRIRKQIARPHALTKSEQNARAYQKRKLAGAA